jgi:hypothetical protein
MLSYSSIHATLLYMQQAPTVYLYCRTRFAPAQCVCIMEYTASHMVAAMAVAYTPTEAQV